MAGGLPMNLPLLYLYGPEGRTRTAELRYSLRSAAANLLHRGVWLAGWAPPWLRDATVIPVDAVPSAGPHGTWTKHFQTTANLLAGCRALAADGHQHFVLMNDDFFVRTPVAGVPALNAGPLDDGVRSALDSPFGQAHRRTAVLLAAAGHHGALSYELHVPMVVNTHLMAAVLGEYSGQLICKRSLYGNLAGCLGRTVPDPKVLGRDAVLPAGPFVSTSDVSWFGRAGLKLRATWPDPCRYERADSLVHGRT